MSKDNWYKTVNSKTPLNQGDIFFNCPIVKPITNEISSELEATIDQYDVIILSQSCDLVNEKLKIALVSPMFTLTFFSKFDPSFAHKKKREKLREGDFPPYHLLNKPSQIGFPEDFFVVDFHSVFGVPTPYLKDMRLKQKKRLTLNSPYKEHLSQAFARYLMRVGLPSTIPSFT